MPMFVRGLKALINMSVFASVPIWIIAVPEHLETLEMCSEAVYMESYSWEFFPGHINNQEMCNEAVSNNPYTLVYVSNHFKNQKMYKEAMRITTATFFSYS